MIEDNYTLSFQAFEHKILNKVIFDYTLNLMSNVFDAINSIKIEEDELKKAIWLVSVLCNSNDQSHKRKAQLFASLLYLNNKDNIEILKICYILFSRLGNLTATKFLEKLYVTKEDNPVKLKTKYDFGELLSHELLFEREKKIISSFNNSFLITDFQKELWQGLNNISEIAISAPTSSGKSFIIKQYLINEFSIKKNFKVLYIVPSRALINQVSEDFKTELDFNVHIKTSFVKENEIFEKEIYILTPERCIKLLNSKIKIEFVFIDEIQGIEDVYGRGLTFEYVFNEISLKFPLSKFVSAGPNIDNPEKTFKDIFERDCSTIQTKLSPVFQLKVTLKNNEKSRFDIEFQTEKGKYQKFVQDFNYNFSKNQNKGDTIAQLVNYIAPNDFNIVFVHNGYYAQKWAIKYANLKEDDIEIDDEIKELIDFLKEDIHKKYYLIECLKKKIAYHHGTLPDIVRKEIEELYINEKLSTVYCTSTLLEGVNLPANNLFTFEPKKRDTPLTKFEFGNLIGRAGRLKSSLYGTVYYIEDYKDKQKASDYYDAEYDKEIEVFSSNALNSLNINDLNISIKSIEKGDKTETLKAQQISVFLRHKFLKGEIYALKYLKSKNFTDNEINLAIGYLRNNLNEIVIPKKVLMNNPSIDPILQNELYKSIKGNDIRDWVINKNSNFNKFLSFEKIESIPVYDRPFYWQLVNLVTRLNEIFNIFEEGFKKHNQKWLTSNSISLQAKKWLGGAPIGQIIRQNINYLSGLDGIYKIDSENLEDINMVINNTIRYNSSITTHLLPKYIKVLTDILEEILSDQQKEDYKLTISLPTMLELGTQEPVIIQLISSGITRSVAIQLFDIYVNSTSKDYREKNDVLKWLSNQNELKGLKPIYNRYLRRIKVLKSI
ncbi:DEAD/DEAH box helicase [Flavobacterium gelidilacus]|uniref:DEAD/DEAH box helicase n=1 Tax=Flavobacterium gelidilacus TaxID=206041 RepID=UPI00047E5773|nr:DEAD/DEAH box helicase [Flavobacterium gelidilacus]